MKFKLEVVSREYLDDVPNIRHDFEMKDALEFAETVQSSMAHVMHTLKFDADYRDTFQVELRVIIDGELRATEYFRRSESDNTIITRWRVCNY